MTHDVARRQFMARTAATVAATVSTLNSTPLRSQGRVVVRNLSN